MLSKLKVVAACFFCFAAYVLVPVPSADASTVASPVISAISSGRDGNYTYPVASGDTATNTEVLVYIDGNFKGMAAVYGDPNYPHFRFEQQSALSEGKHRIMAVSRDLTSLVLSPPSAEVEITSKPYSVPGATSAGTYIPVPKMIGPNEKTVTSKVKPLITGLVQNGHFARVYIDGVYNGRTSVLFDDSGTANFAYEPFLDLSRGWHTAKAYAENIYGVKSAWSAELHFRIEEDYPAPTIIAPKKSATAVSMEPEITGLVKNGSEVRVFIDKKLDGKVQVEDDMSGTANFVYQPFLPLKNGSHLLYATAVDSLGKESHWSEIIRFTVGAKKAAAKVSSVSEEAELADKDEGEEAVQAVKTPEVEHAPIESKADTGKNAQGGKGETTNSEKKSDVDDILKKLGIGAKEETATSAATSTQDQSEQNRNKLNLAIFLIFLLGVVAWIFWVNRELAKEKKAQAESGREEGKDQRQ
jgi:hypothetical protein